MGFCLVREIVVEALGMRRIRHDLLPGGLYLLLLLLSILVCLRDR